MELVDSSYKEDWELLNEIEDKVNEIVEWINTKEKDPTPLEVAKALWDTPFVYLDGYKSLDNPEE